MGQYTDIVELVAPSSAVAGSQVSVQVSIKNLSNYTIYVTPVLTVSGGVGEGTYKTLVPGQTITWYFSFTMPNYGVKVTADSWCESYYFDWHKDDTVEKNITLASVPASEFGSITIARYERR